jgi:hypothetical protein
MKLIGVTCTLAIGCLLQAHAQECHATAFKNGKVILHETIRTKLMSNGQIQFTDILVDVIASSGRIESTLLYSASGRPIQMIAHLISPRVSGAMTVDFGLLGATLKGSFGSQSKTTFISYPKGVPLLDASNFWFVRDHPKPGDSCTHVEFEFDKMQFAKVTATYVGDRMLTVHGRKVTAHYVTRPDMRFWVDDHWLPYREETSNGTVVKRD